ncbi:MAG: hypothetical protein V4718_04460 [Pseudomonadota bacterium]
MFNPEEFGKAMAEAIRKEVAPLQQEIERLKKQLDHAPDVIKVIAEAVQKAVTGIPTPKDGKDCDMSAVKAMIEEAVKTIPVPKDGKDGKDGTDGKDGRDGVDGLPGEVGAKGIDGCDGKDGMSGKDGGNGVDGLPGEAGARGVDGRDGKDGVNGKDGVSVSIDDVRPILDEAIKAMRGEAQAVIDGVVKTLPVPKDGRDGIDGKDGMNGVKGEKGQDGMGLAGAMIDRDGSLQVTFTNGEVKALGPVVGRDGVNGKDGTDGVGFELFEMEYIPDTHEITVKAVSGIRTKELRYPAGGIRPGGYWREGTTAKAGQAWVHDGSTFYALRETTDKPETKSSNWIIGARKGRDGETTVKTINANLGPIKLGN